ncbi:hypothetical protein AMAG_20484 [Allomyces macrogynus ATCC 38327]|uniref:Uncharacterized protein n=1 Tax=Allomyces macrogynus (strain ATCC 38327) TaxID=578462 RepID=A0A0L0TD60_ALLM3|nr:hypothetical protein AMAG_20484 [Allomyces macrogynus ATCC 38327]|eukprot:KNE72621.1 hypothetical protein AMAG_20484 [Allomyces macrogynus ATCC 38327]
MVLVGLQRDLRDIYEQSPDYAKMTADDRHLLVIEPEEGEVLRRTMKASAYIETSAKTMTLDEIETVFSKIAAVAMGEDKSSVAQLLKKPAKHCIIM